MVAHMVIGAKVHAPYAAFEDRRKAGVELAVKMALRPDPEAIVFALPRGGVPVAAPIAHALDCELRPLLVRKLPLPMSPEMGFGAVSLDGTRWLNRAAMQRFGVSDRQAEDVAVDVSREVARRAAVYPGGKELPDIHGRRVFVVDDGLATGYTMVAACETLRRRTPSAITVAVPVAPLSSVDLVAAHCDEVVCLFAQDSGGFAVASFYRRFPDLTDDEVRKELA